MIESFRHKGLKKLFEKGNASGVNPQHVKKLRRQLAQLHAAKTPMDMNMPGWDFHGLEGDLEGHYAVKVNGNWRLTFTFEDQDAVQVDYQDYH